MSYHECHIIQTSSKNLATSITVYSTDPPVIYGWTGEEHTYTGGEHPPVHWCVSTSVLAQDPVLLDPVFIFWDIVPCHLCKNALQGDMRPFLAPRVQTTDTSPLFSAVSLKPIANRSPTKCPEGSASSSVTVRVNCNRRQGNVRLSSESR